MQSVCSPRAVRLGAAVLRQLKQHVRHPPRHLQIEGTNWVWPQIPAVYLGGRGGRSRVPSRPQLRSEFEGSLGHELCLKTTNGGWRDGSVSTSCFRRGLNLVPRVEST